MVNIIVISVLVAGIGFGIYLFMKPVPKAVQPAAEQEEDEAEVIMAEEYCVIDEAQDGSDPRDGVALSALEATLIEADAEPEEEFKGNERRLKELLELNYRIGAKEEAPKVERREDVVDDTEEDERTFYPAEGPGRRDPFEYQQHNI